MAKAIVVLWLSFNTIAYLLAALVGKPYEYTDIRHYRRTQWVGFFLGWLLLWLVVIGL